MSDDIAKLRSDYAELVGKAPFNGWGAEELQKRIDAALAEKTTDDDDPIAVEAKRRDEASAREAQRIEAERAAREQADKVTAQQDAARERERKANAARAKTLIQVRVNRDFWDDAGVRQRKGTIVEVTVDAAFDGVETGALSRVKG